MHSISANREFALRRPLGMTKVISGIISNLRPLKHNFVPRINSRLHTRPLLAAVRVLEENEIDHIFDVVSSPEALVPALPNNTYCETEHHHCSVIWNSL